MIWTRENVDYSKMEIGDHVEQGVVDDALNCLPPAHMTSESTQMGEPHSHKWDDVNKVWRPTFLTFKREIASNLWVFCGYCFEGENVERGIEYHDTQEQIKFLKILRNLFGEGKFEGLIRGIIHDLENPLQSYCLKEAEYQMNEVVEGDNTPTREDILQLADELYNSESFVNAEFANLRASELYENRYGKAE